MATGPTVKDAPQLQRGQLSVGWDKLTQCLCAQPGTMAGKGKKWQERGHGAVMRELKRNAS